MTTDPRFALSFTIGTRVGHGDREVLLLVMDGDLEDMPPLVTARLDELPRAGLTVNVHGSPVMLTEPTSEPDVWKARRVRQ